MNSPWTESWTDGPWTSPWVDVSWGANEPLNDQVKAVMADMRETGKASLLRGVGKWRIRFYVEADHEGFLEMLCDLTTLPYVVSGPP